MIRHWGGSPVPLCVCGHDAQKHRLDRKKEGVGPCSAVKGVGWCKCWQYVSVFDRDAES